MRSQAFALLLIVAVAVGSLGSVAVVGVARLRAPDWTPPPAVLPSPFAVGVRPDTNPVAIGVIKPIDERASQSITEPIGRAVPDRDGRAIRHRRSRLGQRFRLRIQRERRR